MENSEVTSMTAAHEPPPEAGTPLDARNIQRSNLMRTLRGGSSVVPEALAWPSARHEKPECTTRGAHPY
jgi:hypothetical protein